MSQYPAALDQFTNPQPSDTLQVGAGGLSHSQMHGATFEAIEAIQRTLGTNPQGVETNVATRLGVMTQATTSTAESVQGFVDPPDLIVIFENGLT